jgi:undecaprenyl-diphosphatase
MGAAPEVLPLGRTTIVQFAAAFTNRIAPAGIGAMATNVRDLERSGIRRARATTSIGVNAAAGGIVHVLLLVTLVPIAGVHARVHLPSAPDLSDYWPIVAVILLALSLAGLWNWRHGLKAIMVRIRPHARDVRNVIARPRRAVVLRRITWGHDSTGLRIRGVPRSRRRPPAGLTIVAVVLAGSAIAAGAPTPGGLGALEAALVAGLGQSAYPPPPPWQPCSCPASSDTGSRSFLAGSRSTPPPATARPRSKSAVKAPTCRSPTS